MKTRFSAWAPSGIHRGSIMQSRTRMGAEMPTLTSRAATTGTIQQRRAGTTQQVLVHQTSQALTRPYQTLLHKLRVGEPNLRSLSSACISTENTRFYSFIDAFLHALHI